MRPIKNEKIQKYHIKLRFFLKRVIFLCIIVLAVVMGISIAKELFSTQEALAYADTAKAVEAVETVETGPSSLPSTALASEAGGVQKQDLLILVNWDHTVPYDKPDNLAALSQVFGDEVTLENPDGYINAEAGAAAKEMFLAAQAEGINKCMLSSAYRSILYQDQLWNARKAEDPNYGNDPYTDPVKVVPGKCSEHTTGLAIDILSDSYQQSDDGYADTPEGKWLKNNAYRFGFILRYPKEKEHITGVIFEPWHYRYVGKQAAAEIYKRGVCLEEYLGNTG